MRKIIDINKDWVFVRERAEDAGDDISGRLGAVPVDLPHTWNASDGQDGCNDYYRGAGTYQKRLVLDPACAGKRIYLEFGAVNSVCRVYLDGREIGSHEGGYSKFRLELTGLVDLTNGNLLTVEADNTIVSTVYPLWGDFTFYGGIYRDVKLIVTDSSHFGLMDFGSQGVYVTPRLAGGGADVRARALVENPEGCLAEYEIFDAEGRSAGRAESGACEGGAVIRVASPVLWDGRRRPYLYTLRARLSKDGETLDEVNVGFGIRSFSVDPEEGFSLNNNKLRLCGVSRHQGAKDVGWAVTKESQERDMALIREIGATSVRLAHYQHDDYFYELCDREGLIVWAEIPFMSIMSENPEAQRNAKSQMRELIMQNYNHPSVCFWSVWNEITIAGEGESVYRNTRELNEYIKGLDDTRLTACANIFYTKNDSPLYKITDVAGGNQYYGWYYGEADELAGWIDRFRAENPSVALGVSEYGTEGLARWHTDDPKKWDYSEEYHALYHEVSWRIIKQRPFLWASYVWSMFEFASDSRAEGGEFGVNHKGLVTYDRKIKKDAFYYYKSQWSDEPFVHITSRRYKNRASDRVDVKVYSNRPRVRLTVNGGDFGELAGDDGVFIFRGVPLRAGDNTLVAESPAGERDEIVLTKVAKADAGYVLEQETERLNWFGRGMLGAPREESKLCSPDDDIAELLDNPEAKGLLEKYVDVNSYETMRGVSLKYAMLIRNDSALRDSYAQIAAELARVARKR